MDAIQTTKTITEFVGSIGVGAVVGNVIKSTTPANLKLVPKISVGVGAFVLTNVLGDLAAKALSNNIDEVVKGVRRLKETTVIISETAK